MKVVIRVDASLQIGTGHVMRCLTLAEALKSQGAQVTFICRAHTGNLIQRIESQGFKVHTLTKTSMPAAFDQKLESVVDSELYSNKLFHAEWLGAPQLQDAEQSKPILEAIQPDWLIVDHYAIDQNWQACLKATYKKLMVIDDLADRAHLCDLLLDQTYGRQYQDYEHLVPQHCQMLLGSQFALLRPEFAQWRAYSLERRATPEFKQLLITMGGVDPDNVTGQVLQAVNQLKLPEGLVITVVMGPTAPHLESVRKQAQTMVCATNVLVDVINMAEIMANSDLAIGAAGATTWERCCLGLPTIQMVIADNQENSAKILAKDQVVRVVKIVQLSSNVLANTLSSMNQLILKSSLVTDGLGCQRTVKSLRGVD